MSAETGWLIELKPSVSRRPVWFHLEEQWVDDASKALRFARKQDADAFIEHTGWTEAFASQHLWSDPPKKPAPEVFDRTNGHEWAKWEFASMTLICCNQCGIVRRADDTNPPCKGKVKVGLRATPNQTGEVDRT